MACHEMNLAELCTLAATVRPPQARCIGNHFVHDSANSLHCLQSLKSHPLHKVNEIEPETKADPGPGKLAPSGGAGSSLEPGKVTSSERKLRSEPKRAQLQKQPLESSEWSGALRGSCSKDPNGWRTELLPIRSSLGVPGRPRRGVSRLPADWPCTRSEWSEGIGAKRAG